jgi:hypothetical protein
LIDKWTSQNTLLVFFLLLLFLCKWNVLKISFDQHKLFFYSSERKVPTQQQQIGFLFVFFLKSLSFFLNFKLFVIKYTTIYCDSAQWKCISNNRKNWSVFIREVDWDGSTISYRIWLSVQCELLLEQLKWSRRITKTMST